MRLNKTERGFLFALLCSLLRFIQGQASMRFRISYEGKRDYMLNVTFNNSLSTELFRCLCDGNHQLCAARYEVNNLQVNLILYEGYNQNLPSSSSCLMYTCVNSARSVTVNCTREIYPSDPWRLQTVRPTFISLGSLKTCSDKCVGFNFTFSEEFIQINDNQLGAENCSSICYSSMPTLQPSTHHLAATTNTSSPILSQDEIDYTETIVISVVPGGILIIVLIALVIVTLVTKYQTWRPSGGNKHRQGQPSETTPEFRMGDNSVSNFAFIDDTSNNNSTLNKGAVFRQDPFNPGKDFAYSTASPIPDHEKFARNNAGRDGGTTDAGRISSGMYGEYETVDDMQIRPTSVGGSSTDGYSTIDNSDYYNISNTDASPETGHSKNSDDSPETKGYEIVQRPGHNPSSPKHANQSLYSVAGPVEGDAERGTANQLLETPQILTWNEKRDNSKENAGVSGRIYFDLEPVDND